MDQLPPLHPLDEFGIGLKMKAIVRIVQEVNKRCPSPQYHVQVPHETIWVSEKQSLEWSLLKLPID
jgi:hypothetical protein